MTSLKNALPEIIPEIIPENTSPGNPVEFNQSDEDFETLEVTSVRHVWGWDYTDTYKLTSCI